MKKEYTISVFSEHKVGLLHRITVIFSRRKINIESLNTSESEVRGIFRFTIVIEATEDMVRTVTKQIEKQIGILKAFYHTIDEIVYQEIALYKVPTVAFANAHCSPRSDRSTQQARKTRPAGTATHSASRWSWTRTLQPVQARTDSSSVAQQASSQASRSSSSKRVQSQLRSRTFWRVKSASVATSPR